MSRVLSALFVATLITFTFRPAVAEACSCMAPGSPTEELERSSAVFEGVVTGISQREAQGVVLNEVPRMPAVIVSFNVTRAWKGVQTETVVVETATNSAACGFSFTVGETYVVYARSEGGGLMTGICSRTKAIANAAEDLSALGGAATPVTIEDPEPEPEEAPSSETVAVTAPPGAGGCGSCAATPRSNGESMWLAVMVGALLMRRRS